MRESLQIPVDSDHSAKLRSRFEGMGT